MRVNQQGWIALAGGLVAGYVLGRAFDSKVLRFVARRVLTASGGTLARSMYAEHLASLH